MFSINDADEIFQEADINKDGRISCKELGNMFKKFGVKLSQRDLMKMIDTFDIDISRDLDIEEFRELVKDVVSVQRRFKDINEAFKTFKGGFVMNFDEIKLLCSGLQEKLNENEILDIISKLDKKKTGLVRFDSFAKAYAYKA